ncbi:OPT family oligopeptide transporter [Butyrivibrio sp. MC2013]|uniref:OPT family oligopeptide transporter n=1 Tax=Butyrivibrio sp. MC2013 TaxID=1280686 RepID=UPI00041FDA65|nr:oligopeptide transporter, OPT family [Butyrivibrio sp. MC2013]
MGNEEFKPFVPADKKVSELTVTSVIIGILLAVIFGAANAYLGLRVGMTVSASIPAAVISMAIVRYVLKRDSILENNMVQTIGSAGEAVAAGAIFTMPVLFLWAQEGVTGKPSIITITAISLVGGILGVLFMIPLRNALIVKEHGNLPYPEGTACADVLLAGEEGGEGAKHVFMGLGVSALIKFIVDGLKVAGSVITIPVKAMKTEFSGEVYPALIGVGYICGIKISSYMFAGGLLGWFVLIPAIVTFGADTVLYPGTVTIGEMYAANGAGAIWSSYIRYIGAGAVAFGGIVSLIRVLPMIFSAFTSSVKDMTSADKVTGDLRTNKNLSSKLILVVTVIVAVLLWLLPAVPVNFIGALLIILFGFFCATVSSRMVGLVGSSNNPVSGMAIATLLFSTLILKSTGLTGASGLIGAICIGSVICIIAGVAGDTSQDLKTGYILGATPRNQQIGELIGVIVSAFTIGGVLLLLDKAWGFGTPELAAPQATLMKMITEGVMNGNLPWALIMIGIFVGAAMLVLKVPILPFAIGLYLPLELSTTIMIGGAIRYLIDRRNNDSEENSETSHGILFCSGLIAGEGLIGIVLAIFAVFGFDKVINLSSVLNLGTVGGIIVLAAIVALVFKSGLKKNEK